jgi:hypothetical protein
MQKRAVVQSTTMNVIVDAPRIVKRVRRRQIEYEDEIRPNRRWEEPFERWRAVRWAKDLAGKVVIWDMDVEKVKDKLLGYDEKDPTLRADPSFDSLVRALHLEEPTSK